MISIIVSSYNSTLFNQFEANIKQTIGTPYEIIRIENPGLMGICKAYNIGAEKAKYNYLCFAHEDIIFNSQNWGLTLIDDFNSEPNIGLIGIAGTRYKSWVISGWGGTNTKFVAMNLIQGNKKLNGLTTKYHVNEYNTSLVQVTALDGCFLFSTKPIYNKHRFDENTFTNYHSYDLDFSLKVSQTHKVVVSFNILITHLSNGDFNRNWLNDSVKLHKKWKKLLPKTIGIVSSYDIRLEEEIALYNLIRSVIDIQYGYKELLTTYFSLTFIKLFGIKEWLRIFYTSLKVAHFEFKQLKHKRLLSQKI